MTVVQLEQGIASRLTGLGDLHLERTDISFSNIDAERVRVVVTVHNRGAGRSRRSTAVLQAAPLGAFVPWSPLARIVIPEIDAGDSVEVSTVVPRPATAPKGFFDGDPPRKLTAISPGDEESAGRSRRRHLGRGFGFVRQLFQLIWPTRTRSIAEEADSEPLDLPDFLADGSFHWAGNINVLMNGKAVERHMAQAVRIHPAVANLVMFFVGDHRSDEYMFELKGPGAHWDAALFGSSEMQTLLVRPDPSQALQQSQWIKLDKTQMMLLAFRPPADCPSAELNVHVTRRQTGQTAIVEFSFDPSAAGSGCYTV